MTSGSSMAARTSSTSSSRSLTASPRVRGRTPPSGPWPGGGGSRWGNTATKSPRRRSRWSRRPRSARRAPARDVSVAARRVSWLSSHSGPGFEEILPFPILVSGRGRGSGVDEQPDPHGEDQEREDDQEGVEERVHVDRDPVPDSRRGQD